MCFRDDLCCIAEDKFGGGHEMEKNLILKTTKEVTGGIQKREHQQNKNP